MNEQNYSLPVEITKQTETTPETIINLKTGFEEILYCITIYNEPGEALLVSLCAIVQNLYCLYKNGMTTQVNKTTLCVIADGRNSLSESTLQFLTNLGLYNTEHYCNIDEMNIYDSMLNSKKLFSLLSMAYESSETDKRWFEVYADSFGKKKSNKINNNWISPEHPDEVRILLCIKSQNRGKLNSHWWFFDILCRYLKPIYCLQLDIGTVPQYGALFYLLKALEQNPKVGAAASQIMINPAKNPTNLLHIWQFGDFAIQKLMDWPAELIFGYLTVIPGQFCIFRWDALKENDESYPETKLNEIKKHKAPLDHYFRGLKKLGPFESNMFLAEDRILGFEIFSRKNCNWKLQYFPSSVAITDPCDSVQELLRQRRRWINSSFTCNLWLIAKIGQYLKNSSATIIEKLHALLAVPWLGLNNLIIWILPALIIILYKIFIDQIPIRTDIVNGPYLIIKFLYYGFIVSIVLQLILFLFAKLNKIAVRFFYISGALYTSILLGLLFLLYNGFDSKESKILLYVFISEPLFLLIIAILYSRKLFYDLVKIIIQYIILRPFMILMLSMYAFCNLHNHSWGTKGLDIVSHFSKSSNIDTDGDRRVYKFYRFRFIFITMWLISNTILVILFYQIKPLSAFIILKLILLSTFFIIGFKFTAGLSIALNSIFKHKKNSL